jgi:hypothetical protein
MILDCNPHGIKLKKIYHGDTEDTEKRLCWISRG